jgi:hypothetical protein
MNTADGFEMTEQEFKAWRGQPEYLDCCDIQDCPGVRRRGHEGQPRAPRTPGLMGWAPYRSSTKTFVSLTNFLGFLTIGA